MACVTTCGAACPQMTWEAVVLKSRADPSFKKAVLEAVRVKVGEALRRFTLEDVTHDRIVGMVTEREYDLITEPVFESSFGMKPADSGVTFEEFSDELGRPIRAIAVETGKLKLRVVSQSGVMLREMLHTGAEQVRANQGSDFQKLFMDDLYSCSSTPKVVKGKASMSKAELEEIVREKKEQLAAQQAEAERLRSLQAQAGEAVPTHEADDKDEEDANEEEEEAEFEGYDNQSQTARLPSQRAKLEREKLKEQKRKKQHASRKGGKKAPSQGRMGGKDRKMPELPSSAHLSSAIASAASEETLGSLVGGSGASSLHRSNAASVASATSKPKPNSFAKWQQDISIPRLLAGETLGDRMYNCRRYIESMENSALTPSELAEFHAIRDLHNLASLCKDVAVSQCYTHH